MSNLSLKQRIHNGDAVNVGGRTYGCLKESTRGNL